MADGRETASRRQRRHEEDFFFFVPFVFSATEEFADRLKRPDVIGCRFDRDHHRDREQQTPHPPDPSPEQHRDEHGDRVQLAGFAREPRRDEIAFERGDAVAMPPAAAVISSVRNWRNAASVMRSRKTDAANATIVAATPRTLITPTASSSVGTRER